MTFPNVLTVRRLLAVLSVFTMLHLILVGAPPCASNGATDTTQSMAGMTMGVGETHHESNSPEKPAQQRCCEAMSGCTVTLAMTCSTRMAMVSLVSGEISIAGRTAMLSFQSAPEPPPPKA